MRIVMLLLLAMLPACQTSPKPVEPTMQMLQRPVRTRPDTFIQSYSQALANDRDQLVAQGLAADHATVRAYVDAYLPAGQYTLQSTGATVAVLRRLRVDSVTNNLIAHGYRRNHLADAAQAKRLVRAAAGVFGASLTDGDLATFAPTVAIADLDRVDETADRSTALIYRVVEPIKNAPPKGSEIRVTLRGPQAPSPYPPPPQPGEGEMRMAGRVVLFLAPPRMRGLVQNSGDSYSRVTQPMRLDGEKLTAGYHSDAPEITLTRLRAVVREQVCAPRFKPVGKPGGTSLSC